MNPAPSIFEPDFTVDNLQFANLLTGSVYGFNDFVYINRESERIRDKMPEWLVKPSITTPHYPDGVAFAVKALRSRPVDAAPSQLYRDILLSYFGNSAKTELDRLSWIIPEPAKQSAETFPWDRVEKLTSISKKVCLSLRYNGMTLKEEDFIAHLLLQQYGTHSATASAKIYPLMHAAGVPLPLAKIAANDPTGYKALLLRYTIDEATGKILALTPPPAKTVEVSADLPEADVPASEKKTSEVPSQAQAQV